MLGKRWRFSHYSFGNGKSFLENPNDNSIKQEATTVKTLLNHSNTSETVNNTTFNVKPFKNNENCLKSSYNLLCISYVYVILQASSRFSVNY